MKVKGKTYRPIGNGLGYCIGGGLLKKSVFYFKGYPQIPYQNCEIIELTEADPKSFRSDTVMGEGRDKNNIYFQGVIVEKGRGVKLNQDWEFIPRKGIKCQSVELFFDTNRAFNRNLLGNEEQFNLSRSTLEDSYKDFQNTNTWFRLSYNDANQLKEIEFLNGFLRLKDVRIMGDGKDDIQLQKRLLEINYKLSRKDNEYWIDKQNKFLFSSDNDMGGDSDKCAYFYTADCIEHLI